MKPFLPLLLLAFLLPVLPSQAQDVVTIIIDQPAAPLKIVRYQVARKGLGSPKGFKHEARYENTTRRMIVASQITFVSYNVFNEFLDLTSGIDMGDVAWLKRRSGTWVVDVPGGFSFQTGFAFVAQVRFEDGEIWQADLDVVLEELHKFDPDLDIARLQGVRVFVGSGR